MARLNTCNVFHAGSDLRRLWVFAGHGKFNLLREETKLPTEPIPAGVVSKDWQTLFQPKLNVAWFTSDKLFLRAVQLPAADFAETQSMVELQLEKISPLPVAQIVWTFDVLPHASGQMQTAVVVIVARDQVEAFLGQLEGDGYMADRLEVPLIDQLQSTTVQDDGVWIYPDAGGNPHACLLAWWYDRVLQNVSLISLPPAQQRGPVLQNQITQTIWAGELEGWLTSAPRFHIVADRTTAAAWEALMPPEQSVEVVEPPPVAELAGRTARRAAAETSRLSLLPPEYGTRYRQRFVDRLWMRSLGALVMLYLVGVLIYFGWVQFANWQVARVENEVARLGPTYTNTLQLKERVKVLQDQLELQFAALDCYRAVADYLPTELTLDSFNVDRGRKLTLMGSAGGGDVGKIQDFNDALRKATDRSQKQLLFTKVNPPNIGDKPGGFKGWTFNCELRRTDTE